MSSNCRRNVIVATGSGRQSLTGTKPGHIATANVSPPPAPPMASQPVVGRVLRARPSTHEPGATLRVEWLIAGRGIPTPTAATFRLRP